MKRYVFPAAPAGAVTVKVEVGFEPFRPVTLVAEKEKNPPDGGVGQAGDVAEVGATAALRVTVQLSLVPSNGTVTR